MWDRFLDLVPSNIMVSHIIYGPERHVVLAYIMYKPLKLCSQTPFRELNRTQLQGRGYKSIMRGGDTKFRQITLEKGQNTRKHDPRASTNMNPFGFVRI